MIHRLRGVKSLSLRQAAQDSPRGFVFRHLVAVLGGVFMVAASGVGCGNQSEDATPDPAEGLMSRGAPAAPAEVQPQALDVQEGADIEDVLAELNRELRRWVMRNRRKPASFEEFVSTSQMQVPPPPAGKKYTLTREMRIALVNR